MKAEENEMQKRKQGAIYSRPRYNTNRLEF